MAAGPVADSGPAMALAEDATVINRKAIDQPTRIARSWSLTGPHDRRCEHVRTDGSVGQLNDAFRAALDNQTRQAPRGRVIALMCERPPPDAPATPRPSGTRAPYQLCREIDDPFGAANALTGLAVEGRPDGPPGRSDIYAECVRREPPVPVRSVVLLALGDCGAPVDKVVGEDHRAGPVVQLGRAAGSGLFRAAAVRV
jgi:hypothetical protein